jgi:hypothetical protein
MGEVTQLLDTLSELDPTGAEAALLCAVAGALLAALTALGFLLVHNVESAARRASPRIAELDLLALWRLNHSPGRSRSSAQETVSPADSSVGLLGAER